MARIITRIGRYSFWGVIVLLTLYVLIGTMLTYGSFQPDAIQENSVFRGRFLESAFWLYLHIFAASLALLVGPFQFIKALRDRFPGVHRWMGRAYLGIGVLMGGISGLVIAQGTKAGLTGVFGFSLLALGWLFTGFQAYSAIRSGRTQDHKRWMIRNYALTCAALTLRLYIGLGIVLLLPSLDVRYGGDFDALFMDIYRLVSWLAWVPNLMAAEFLISRQRRASHTEQRDAHRLRNVAIEG